MVREIALMANFFYLVPVLRIYFIASDFVKYRNLVEIFNFDFFFNI